jgi:hypothetical protein
MSYITSGKLLFVTGAQPLQHFPVTPISTTIITTTFCQIIPLSSQLRLNYQPILLKVYAIREELFAGQHWISTWGALIKPSHLHILLVGHLLEKKSSMEATRSSPVLQSEMHGQTRLTNGTVCHAYNTWHSPKFSILIGHPTSIPLQRCLLHHRTCTPWAPTRRMCIHPQSDLGKEIQ